MSIRQSSFIVALVTVAAFALPAQSVDIVCTASDGPSPPLYPPNDRCQKAADVFKYMSVQLGTVVAGGNAMLGQAGALGGIGHIAIGVRANAIRAAFPVFDNVQLQARDPIASRIPTVGKWVVVPEVDAAVGVVRGFSVDDIRVAGIDVLADVSYLPDYSQRSTTLGASHGKIRIAYGGRLGVVSETSHTPAVSLTFMERALPVSKINATDASGNTIGVTDLKVRATLWRFVASKQLRTIGVAAGVGTDTYHATSLLSYGVDGTTVIQGITAAPTRTNFFADLSFPVLTAHMVAEVGRVNGGQVTTFNSFSSAADRSRFYGSLGVRVAR